MEFDPPNSNGARDSGLLDLITKPGLFARQQIRAMIQRQMVDAIADIEEAQLQPASLDLRLGSRAFRIRASFLPGREKTVREQLEDQQYDEIDLLDGAVLERHCVYLVELQEFVKLQPSISGIANPKSSTGRLDVFIRLITDNAEVFDTVEGGYAGPLYAEISPRSFSIKVRKGSRLNQIRFRRRNSQQTSYDPVLLGDREIWDLHKESMLVDGEPTIRKGLVLRVGLSTASLEQEIVGYRAQTFTNTIDIDRVGEYDYRDYWEPLIARDQNKLILDPQQFYILASKERLHIPPHLAAEMIPDRPFYGRIPSSLRGFFRSGFWI